MKLRNKRFWIFEGTIMSTVLIFDIICFSCGFSELIGASIYGVFSFTHLIAGTATWIVCKIDYWANLAIWQIVFSSAFSWQETRPAAARSTARTVLIFFMSVVYLSFVKIRFSICLRLPHRLSTVWKSGNKGSQGSRRFPHRMWRRTPQSCLRCRKRTRTKDRRPDG